MDLKQQYPSDIATFIEKKSTEGPFKFFYPKLSTIYLEDSYDLLIIRFYSPHPVKVILFCDLNRRKYYPTNTPNETEECYG